MSILVTGATGNVGRHLVRTLAADGHRVRALTRDPDAADLPEDVEVVRGDLTDLESVAAALEGATALHLLASQGASFDTLEAPEALLEAAEKAGVRRVTVLWNGFHGPVEAAAERSGLEWTIVQPGTFMSNSRYWAEEALAEGVIREPFAEVVHYPVHEADIAAVAAAALTGDGHAGKRYTLTGPDGLTVGQQVEAISRASGRPIRYEELTAEQAKERMRAMGIGEESIEFIVGWNADPENERRLAAESADIAAITGAPPRTFARWAQENAAVFR